MEIILSWYDIHFMHVCLSTSTEWMKHSPKIQATKSNELSAGMMAN